MATNRRYIILALQQAAIARKYGNYPSALKWLSYARAFRLVATAPVAPLPTVEACTTHFQRQTRTAQKILRHGMMYSRGTGTFFNMLIAKDNLDGSKEKS